MKNLNIVEISETLWKISRKYYEKTTVKTLQSKKKFSENVKDQKVFRKISQTKIKDFFIMDNPNFGSSHLSSPALVVFSQAANGLSDALRLQRPFHSQMPDAKDLHHLSLVSSYGTHLLHGFQPHFLHQHLNPAVSSASSPFGSGGAFVKPFPSNLSLPSAFAPPKCLGFGLDQVSILETSPRVRVNLLD